MPFPVPIVTPISFQRQAGISACSAMATSVKDIKTKLGKGVSAAVDNCPVRAWYLGRTLPNHGLSSSTFAIVRRLYLSLSLFSVSPSLSLPPFPLPPLRLSSIATRTRQLEMSVHLLLTSLPSKFKTPRTLVHTIFVVIVYIQLCEVVMYM